MVHRSHISSKEAKVKGWSRVPTPAIREETKELSKEVGIEYMSGEYITLRASDGIASISSTVYTRSGTGDYPYQPYHTWFNEWITPNTYTYPSITQVQTIIKEKEVTKEVEKRTLFKVYVIDPRKNGEVLMDGKLVIAINENQAMLKVGVADVADKEGLDLEQVDIYVQTIGTFIRPRKETQKVKITKEDED